MSSADDPDHWREKAEKAMRLARGITDKDAAEKLKALAAEYLQRAEALTGQFPARPEPVQQELQQHQQVPDPEAEKDE